MRSGSTRRRFLEATGAAVGMAGLSGEQAGAAAPVQAAAGAAAPGARPKVAALTSVYSYLSHAYHIVGRFLDGFPVYDGRSGPQALHRPSFEIASLFIEQVAPATDLGRARAERHKVR